MDLYLSQRRPVSKCLSPFGSLSCFFFGCCSSLMFRRSPVRPFQRNFQYVKELFLGSENGRIRTCTFGSFLCFRYTTFSRPSCWLFTIFLWPCGSGRHDTCNRPAASVGTLNTLSGTRYVGGLSRLFTPCCNPFRGRGAHAPRHCSLLSCRIRLV